MPRPVLGMESAEYKLETSNKITVACANLGQITKDDVGLKMKDYDWTVDRINDHTANKLMIWATPARRSKEPTGLGDLTITVTTSGGTVVVTATMGPVAVTP